MRIGLIAALRRSDDGGLRAALPLAGRSVIAWQASLLQSLGIQRVLCLTQDPSGEILALQQMLEGQGVQFHALRGFAAIPALVRAEDDLVIFADGLVPEPAVVRAVLGDGETLQRAVAMIPADHPLATEHPEDFERVDAARHWAGVLAMRGAPVQHLADFADDADAIGLLLRLALQAGTPARDLSARELVPESWLLAQSASAVAAHESALIARAAPPADWRAPGSALAASLVRALVPQGLAQGALIAGSTALVLLLLGVMAATFGFGVAGLLAAGLGAFAAQASMNFAVLAARLRREEMRFPAGLAGARDLLAGLTIWFVLSPVPDWQPLAALGPVTIALAVLVARRGAGLIGVLSADRPLLLLALALAAAIGFLPEALACLALGLCAALLLREGKE
ncbi:MAG: hypothetical protein KAF27_03825 [Porphyrobacter sp.]|nr:hypothetical protein [Porphyrobacter sp.]